MGDILAEFARRYIEIRFGDTGPMKALMANGIISYLSVAPMLIRNFALPEMTGKLLRKLI